MYTFKHFFTSPEFFRPIGRTSVQLPSTISGFYGIFESLSRVRVAESSGFMERAMGIEPTSEAWEASNTTLKTLE
jgi:hypothetical protein